MTFPKTDSAGPFDIRKTASLVAEVLSEVGINVSLDEVEVGSFIADTLLPGNFEMAFFPNLPYDEPDKPLTFYHTRGVTGTGNWNSYTNPEIDELVEAQSVELDENTRREIVLEGQRPMIKEHGPQVTLPSGYEYHARRSYVHYPYEIGEQPSSAAGPWGSDI